MTGDLFYCIQKDKEPLSSYVRRFLQLKSQTPDVEEKVSITPCIKGLNPRQTASHLSRKRPKTMQELLAELEEHCRSDEDHRRRVAERNHSRQNQREHEWPSPLHLQNHRTPSFPTNQILPIEATEGTSTLKQTNTNHQNPNPPQNQNDQRAHNPRGRGRGSDSGPQNQNFRPRLYYCAFHGKQTHHSTYHCPETKKTIKVPAPIG